MAFYGKKKNRWWWAVVVVALLIFHFTGLLNPLENLAITAAKPLARFFYDSGSGWRHSYQERQEQKTEAGRTQALESEVARLTVANAQLKETEQENTKLRAQLNFAAVSNRKSLLANVISQNAAFDIEEGDQDIVIDRGAKDGLREGQGVINENGVLIGKVAEVRDHLAKVCLTTNSNCKFAAAIQSQALNPDQNQTMGVTEGDLGLTIKMNYIPQSDKVNLNDTVITSGLGGEIPRGLVIGKISQVNNQSNEIWQDVAIEPLFDSSALTIVNVLAF